MGYVVAAPGRDGGGRSSPTSGGGPGWHRLLPRQAVLMRVTVAVLALLVLAACSFPPASATPPADQVAAGDFAGPVAIGDGRQIYLHCRGTGSPTVVLMSGYHDSADLWTMAETQPPVPAEAVLPGLAGFVRVCAFDRPGTLRYSEHAGSVTDRSTPVPMPRTARDVVADLHALLAAAHVPGPYLIAAHSLGGLFARLYAQTYPDEVKGLVLVDTFAPETPQIFGDKWPAYRDLLSATGTGSDPAAERIDLDASIAQVQQAPPLRPMPVAVLSKTEPFGGLPADLPAGFSAQDLESRWPLVQAAVVRIQPQTPQTMATGSDHYIQVSQPDLIIHAARLVVGRAAGAGR